MSGHKITKIMLKAIKEHRSVRNFIENKPISDEQIAELIAAASRASTTGGMQLYSIIVSQSQEIKDALSPLHYNQPMVKKCSAVVTFVADTARFSTWCRQRGTEPGYDNFAWWVNATIDTLLAAQNFCTQAQEDGLGICYLGTTIYTTKEIIEILKLPKGVIPITTVVVGYPEGETGLTPRLPIEAVWHKETYQTPTHQEIEEYWAGIENSEQTAKLLQENKLENLAQIFTQRRYTKEQSLQISQSYFEALRQQGFID